MRKEKNEDKVITLSEILSCEFELKVNKLIITDCVGPGWGTEDEKPETQPYCSGPQTGAKLPTPLRFLGLLSQITTTNNGGCRPQKYTLPRF